MRINPDVPEEEILGLLDEVGLEFILLYSVPEGNVSVKVIFEQETSWLSQKKMAELFNVSAPTIHEHLQNVFATNELTKDQLFGNS